MLQRVAIYIDLELAIHSSNSSSPRSPGRTSNPPDEQLPILDTIVSKRDTLESLLLLLYHQVPAVRDKFHAFRFRSDWNKKDLLFQSTVGDTADAWPDFSNRNLSFARYTSALPLKFDEPLELQLVTRTERLEEIHKDVLYVEKAYWHHVSAVSYLEKMSVLLSDNNSNDTDLVSNHSHTLNEQRLAKISQISHLRSMMTQWRAYSDSHLITDFAANLPETTTSDDDSIETIQIWLRHIRKTKTALNRVPDDLVDKFLPFLRLQLREPPAGFNTLGEAEGQRMTATGTSFVHGTSITEKRKLQDEYVATKSAQLGQVSEKEIADASTTAWYSNASRSFMESILVNESFRQFYPRRTEQAKWYSLEKLWGYLTEVEKRYWWKRDAWMSKIKKFSNRNSKWFREAWLPLQSPPSPSLALKLPVVVSAVPFPASNPSFTIKSGYILWGQLATIAYGGVVSPATASDEPTAPRERWTGGTVVQHAFTYRARCRNGTWKIARISANDADAEQFGDTPEDMNSVGWIVYHESVNLGDAVVRASRITTRDAISNGNTHPDKGVVYVNRYDWSGYGAATGNSEFSSNFSAWFHDDPEVADIFELLKNHHGVGHFAVVDAAKFSLDMLECGMAARMNRIGSTSEGTFEWLFQGKEGGAFGACVQDKNTGYELGWQIYEPITETSEDSTLTVTGHELVAFLYDSSYHTLNGDRFLVDGQVYPTVDEVMAE
ncbi:hypothetical protein HDU93_002901 [Gonapodya sp. JEL0774]|nr:hypothetical protein HDU93_002901 [Gonapodya sp. JEL0774]